MVSITIDRQDGLSSSTAIKGPVRLATTANIVLSGLQTIDGVAAVTDDRVLVMQQTAASENGIYVVDTGAWRRAKDFSGNRDVRKGTRIYVTDGATLNNKEYIVTSENPVEIDTDNITFIESPASSVGNPGTTGLALLLASIPAEAWTALGIIPDSSLPARIRALATPIADANLALSSGLYSLDTGGANVPSVGLWAMIVEAVSASYVTQTAYAYSVDLSTNTSAWRRDLNTGVWSSWYKLQISQAEQDARYCKFYIQAGDPGAVGAGSIWVAP